MSTANPPHDAALPAAAAASSQLSWKRDGGCFICLERHANASETCDKSFMAKQALEGHRKRMGCQPWKLPSNRAASKFRGLEPEASRQLKRQSNTTAVSKYRRTLDGDRAVFRSRHMAKYRMMACNAVPSPLLPKAPDYTPPPLSWLIVDAKLLPFKALKLFDRGKIVLSHKTWSVHFHPDKVEVRARDSDSISNTRNGE